MLLIPKTRLPSPSLVIPTFNRADLINETLESVFSQQAAFAEIIVVDDGSTDHTPSVLASFGKHIKVIRTENRGVQVARNTGVAAASNVYVTLCDSDDLLQPEYVDVVTLWLAGHDNIDILYVNFCTFTETASNSDKFSQAPPGWFAGGKQDIDFVWEVPDLYLRTVTYQPLFPTGVTFKKRFYEAIGGYDKAFNRIGGEDWEFTLRAIASGKVALCKRPLTRIRKHAGNDSGDKLRLLVGEVRILEYALANHAQAEVYTEKILESIERRRIAAFNIAFSDGNFGMVDEISRSLRSVPIDAKFQLKMLVSSLPRRLRDQVWRFLQCRYQ